MGMAKMNQAKTIQKDPKYICMKDKDLKVKLSLL